MVARWPGCRSSSGGAPPMAMQRAARSSSSRSSRMRWTPRATAARCTAAPCTSTTPKPASATMSVRRSRRIVRVERQVGAAGLEHRQQPHHQLERTLGADPDQDVGSDAEALQMMRQAVGVGVEGGVGRARGPRRSPRWRPACARPARQTAPARSRVLHRPAAQRRAAISECAKECPVSFQSRRMVSRSAASRIDSAPSARSGSATAALQQPDQPRAQRLDGRCGRTGRLRIPARPRSRPARRRPRAAPRARPRGRTSRSPSRPAAPAPKAPAAPARRPPRRPRTPASPGTADAATATAPD